MLFSDLIVDTPEVSRSFTLSQCEVSLMCNYFAGWQLSSDVQLYWLCRNWARD